MHLTVLIVPDCPSGPLLEGRLAAATKGRPGVTVSRQVISSPAEAPSAGQLRDAIEACQSGADEHGGEVRGLIEDMPADPVGVDETGPPQ